MEPSPNCEDVCPPDNEENVNPRMFGEFSNLSACTPPFKRRSRVLTDQNVQPKKRNTYAPNKSLSESLHLIKKTFTETAPQRIKFMKCDIDVSSLNSQFIETLACKHLRKEFNLNESSVLIHISESGYEVLDGRHRIAAVRRIFLRRYGSADLVHLTSAQIAESEIKAIVLKDVTPSGLKRLYGWVHNETMSLKSERVHHKQRKDISDLMEMMPFLVPNAPRSGMKRTLSFATKSILKEALGNDVRAHFFRAAFVKNEDKQAVLDVADLLDKGRIVSGKNEYAQSQFWSAFLDTYDGEMKECKMELERLVKYCREETTMTAKEFVEKLRAYSTQLHVFLRTYYDGLSPFCWLLRGHKFPTEAVASFIKYCKNTFNLEKMSEKNQVPCKLKMLQMASLTLNPSNNANPLFTTLDDLRTPDTKHLHLSSDATFVYIDMTDFEDCVSIVCKEIAKMEIHLHSVLLVSPKRSISEYGSWKELGAFLQKNEYKLEKCWLAPHVDVDLEANERESFLLHYTKIRGFKLKGHKNEVVIIKDVPTLFPPKCSGCYFVGTKDCQNIRPGIVPQSGNNVIIYRSMEDINAAFDSMGPALRNHSTAEEEEDSMANTKNSFQTPSTPSSEPRGASMKSQQSLFIAENEED